MNAQPESYTYATKELPPPTQETKTHAKLSPQTTESCLIMGLGENIR
jgi:hypothetical protein